MIQRTEKRKSFTFIGDDCPPGYRRVGTIDVADPADVRGAQDQGYRIGSIYDGLSFSCAEPCAADIYERLDDASAPWTKTDGDDRDRIIGNLLDRWDMTPNDLKEEMREHGCGKQLDELLHHVDQKSESPNFDIPNDGGDW